MIYTYWDSIYQLMRVYADIEFDRMLGEVIRYLLEEQKGKVAGDCLGLEIISRS